MSVAYRAVGWNRQKRCYDLVLGGALLGGLAVSAALTFGLRPATTPETFLIRFTAVAALTLLHVILAIGPLARLDRRFLPLLYNRRHLGVTMFLLALGHGVFAIVQFHGAGNANPLVSMLTAYRRDYGSGQFAHFPFEIFGLGALLILFLMAATSHDFWLRNLGASAWKTLHMGVYVAYGLILVHVALGPLQSDRSPVPALALGGGFLALVALHLAAFLRERRLDRLRRAAEADGYERVATVRDLRPDEGHVAMAGGQRLALYVHAGRLFALSNVCRHQGGPLGEGRVVNGCLTCPWHGYQYRLEDGCSPPPFHEIAPTFAVRIVEGAIFVHPTPLPPGTRSEGAPVDRLEPASAAPFYIGWQPKSAPAVAAFTRRAAAVLVVLAWVAMAVAAAFHNPVDRGQFDFGNVRPYEGTLHTEPLAFLVGDDGRNRLLVGEGKFAPPDVIRGHDGQRVRLDGTLIERAGVAMVQVDDLRSLAVLDATRRPLPPQVSLGEGEFTGELVDTKCFLGVMRPGTGKVHRGCAARCLSGGVPPGLLVRDHAGADVALFLVGTGGGPLAIDSQLAARTLRVRGELTLLNGTPVLHVAGFEILP